MPGGKSAWTTACQSSPGPPGRASPHECPTVRETRDQTHHPTRVGSILHGAWRPYAGPRQGQVPPLPVVALDWPPRGSPCQIEPTTPTNTKSPRLTQRKRNPQNMPSRNNSLPSKKRHQSRNHLPNLQPRILVHRGQRRRHHRRQHGVVIEPNNSNIPRNSETSSLQLPNTPT